MELSTYTLSSTERDGFCPENSLVKQESQMAYGTAESFPGVYVFCIDIMNNLTIFAGKPRKQTHLIIVSEKHLLHKVLQEKGS